MPKDPRKRAAWTPEIGKLRATYYRGAHEKLKQAIDGEFYIEAIAICDSMLSDRMESRLGFLSGDDQRFLALGTAAKTLLAKEPAENIPARELYQSIGKWASGRNHAVHEVVKLQDSVKAQSFSERYELLRLIAEEGVVLVSKMNKMERTLRRADATNT